MSHQFLFELDVYNLANNSKHQPNLLLICGLTIQSLGIDNLININNWPYLRINDFQLMNRIRSLA